MVGAPGDPRTSTRWVLGGKGPIESRYADLPVLPPSFGLSRFQLRLDVADEPGVLAQVARVLAEHDISIETVNQAILSVRGTQLADLVISTHRAPVAALAATVGALGALEVVDRVTSVLRVEGE